MEPLTIALFGEAESGDYGKVHYCQTLPDLVDKLGNPPPESRGLHLAVQSLLYEHDLFFFRVEEEGFSLRDYFEGLMLLKKERKLIRRTAAICLPGVADPELLKAFTKLCDAYRQVMITTEPDLYDYLTNSI